MKSPLTNEIKNVHRKSRNNLKRKEIANFLKTISNLSSKHKGKINKDKDINLYYKTSAYTHTVNRIQ